MILPFFVCVLHLKSFTQALQQVKHACGIILSEKWTEIHVIFFLDRQTDSQMFSVFSVWLVACGFWFDWCKHSKHSEKDFCLTVRDIWNCTFVLPKYRIPLQPHKKKKMLYVYDIKTRYDEILSHVYEMESRNYDKKTLLHNIHSQKWSDKKSLWQSENYENNFFVLKW